MLDCLYPCVLPLCCLFAHNKVLLLETENLYDCTANITECITGGNNQPLAKAYSSIAHFEAGGSNTLRNTVSQSVTQTNVPGSTVSSSNSPAGSQSSLFLHRGGSFPSTPPFASQLLCSTYSDNNGLSEILLTEQTSAMTLQAPTSTFSLHMRPQVNLSLALLSRPVQRFVSKG